jgi:Fur family ferric uptake transcriptional regulator
LQPELGLATVYRTLDLLVELDIIHKIEFGDGRTRFEVGGEEHHRHHHLICLTCGQVSEFNDDLLENLEEALSKTNGFKVVDHQVKFFGICSNCQKIAL